LCFGAPSAPALDPLSLHDALPILFRRYHNQLQDRLLWMNDLAYDHPTRDLAECIRLKLLQKDDPMNDIRTFLHDYQRVRPLSILDRKSTRLNSSHVSISYAVFCLK